MFNTLQPAVSLAPRFYLQNHCAKSGTLGFSERTSEVLTNLSWEVRFLWVTDNGDFRVCLIRINPPFRLRHVFSSKIIAPNLEPLVFGTNSGSADEPLMGGSFFCGERGGDRSIGEANLRKGRQPLLWKRPCRPLQWKRPCRRPLRRLAKPMCLPRFDDNAVYSFRRRK